MNEYFNESINIYNKQIGSISAENLVNYDICIPDIQRLEDSDVVEEIIQYQTHRLCNHKHINFLGVLNIHHIKDTGKYLLVDGQHRYAAIKKLYQLGHKFNIVIEIVSVSSENELKHNYELINKNTPLPEFPVTIEKGIPEKAALYFKNQYPTLWSKNSRARKPHIYWNFFQEALGCLTEKLKIDSSQELIDLVSNFNSKRMTRIEKGVENPLTKGISEKIMNKCKSIQFYLGLYPHISDEYCYEWVKDIIYDETGQVIKKLVKSRKKSIPKKIKSDSWNKYIGEDKGQGDCFCCGETINSKSFHAGHIISEHNGGEIIVDNIIPVCSGCNLSMGKKNMVEFIQDHYPNQLDRFHNRMNKDLYESESLSEDDVNTSSGPKSNGKKGWSLGLGWV